MTDHHIDAISVSAYRVPTDRPESDGTLCWNHTDVVYVEIGAGDHVGLGWTFSTKEAAGLVDGPLKAAVLHQSPMPIEGLWQAMNDAVRNDGRGGVCAAAISAVDVALWDLKAKILNVSLVELIGTVRNAVPLYGSGGFTSYTDAELSEQLSGWVDLGIKRVKMKVGRDTACDPRRVRCARQAIGDSAELFIDANGAYSRKQALRLAEQFAAEADVRWFEEPVSSDDLAGMRFLRGRVPSGIEIAAGEYGNTLDYFRRMLEAGSVDCLQADATRCGGITGFLKAATLCEAHHLPLSAHCAPQLHAHVGCCVRPLRHVEYFHDHVRIDALLLDGVLEPHAGALQPDRSRQGHGLLLKKSDAARFAVRP